jgi:hypothetical protein
MRRLILALVLAGLAGFGVVSTAEARPTIFFWCPPDPDSCSSDWYRQPVTIKWDWVPKSSAVVEAGCDSDDPVDSDTRGAIRFCRVRDTSDGVATTVEVSLKVDMTPPLLAGARPSRPPDTSGWYRNTVGVTFSGTDATSGILGCTRTAYGGPDSRSARVAGVCRDRAGNQSQGTFGLRYDSTAPTVTGIAPARPPDHGTWYTRPIGFGVSGTDGLSGLAGCDPVIYGGPDSAAAAITGTCRDQAGNVAARAFGVPYDATPPALGMVKVRPADGVVRLSWAAVDAVSVDVSRSPGRRGTRRTLMHRGPGTRLVDRAVRNGRRYVYRFTAVDQAGNVATREINVVPGPRLLSPAKGARVTEPPVLRWTPVRGARYYNVQLFRDGRKVLSAWPSRAKLELRRAWRYGGKQRLERGRYHWVVWPGDGPRERNAYGPRIGRRSFVFVPNA